MSEHPYIAGYAAAVTASPYVRAYEAWRYRAGTTPVMLAGRLFTEGYVDGQAALRAVESEAR